MSCWASIHGRGGVFACAAVCAMAVSTVAAAQTRIFSVKTQPAATGVALFAKQADAQILITEAAARGRRINEVRGDYSLEQGLDILLSGTGLKPKYIAPRTYSIVVAAPTPPAPIAQAGPTELEEVIVTAQRRSEAARDVPASLSVLNGEKLSRQGAQSLNDVAARVPGLVLASLGGAGQQQVTLRGVTVGQDATPTVGIYIDDVPFGATGQNGGSVDLALGLGSFDLQRIEVLRGPQGTLYGASAMGGALKYVLNPPSFAGSGGEIQTEASGTSGGGFNYGLRAAANLVVVPDRLALHGSLVRNHDDGVVDNIATGERNVDASDTTTGRLSFLFAATDRLNLRGTVLVQNLDRNGTSFVDYDLTTGKPSLGDLQQSRILPEPFKNRFRLYSLGADYDFGFATLSTTVAYQSDATTFSQDFSQPFVTLLGSFLDSLGSPIDAVGLNGTYGTDKTTAEVRLASHPGGKLDWLAGAFYTYENSENFQQLQGYENQVPIDQNIGAFRLPDTFREEAVFADATYHFTARLEGTVGARLSHNDQIFTQIGMGLIASSNPGSASSDTSETYLATVKYKLDDDGMVYARAASGYRPGGPNLVATDPVTGQPVGKSTFGPDSLWNYEVGAKLRPLPWLTADITVFDIDWRNIQLFTSLNGLSVLANGGAATSKGLEFAFVARPVPHWTFSGSAAYTDARLAEAAPAVSGAAGERLPNVPRVSSTLSVDYDHPLEDGMAMHAGATWRYVGARTASYDASLSYPQYVLPAYGAVDITLGISSKSVDIDLYAKNLFDSRGQTSAYEEATIVGGPAWVSLIQPRTVGVVITKAF